MNIFYIDTDPYEAARAMVDSHVVKMILETAQLLSTAHRVLDGENNVLQDNREDYLYKATHANHPCAIWARTSVENYNWLFDHMIGLSAEYTFRYGKTHKVIRDGRHFYMNSPPYNLRDFDWTQPPLCMPEEYKIFDDSPLWNYRHFYKYGKAHLHKWTKRLPPTWVVNYENTERKERTA